MTKIATTLFSLFVIVSCGMVDSIVVPINNATLDLNRTAGSLDMPDNLFPETDMKLKGNKVVIEKHF